MFYYLQIFFSFFNFHFFLCLFFSFCFNSSSLLLKLYLYSNFVMLFFLTLLSVLLFRFPLSRFTTSWIFQSFLVFRFSFEKFFLSFLLQIFLNLNVAIHFRVFRQFSLCLYFVFFSPSIAFSFFNYISI